MKKSTRNVPCCHVGSVMGKITDITKKTTTMSNNKVDVKFGILYEEAITAQYFTKLFVPTPPRSRKQQLRMRARRMKQTKSWGPQGKTCLGEDMWCPPFKEVIL